MEVSLPNIYSSWWHRLQLVYSQTGYLTNLVFCKAMELTLGSGKDNRSTFLSEASFSSNFNPSTHKWKWNPLLMFCYYVLERFLAVFSLSIHNHVWALKIILGSPGSPASSKIQKTNQNNSPVQSYNSVSFKSELKRFKVHLNHIVHWVITK